MSGESDSILYFYFQYYIYYDYSGHEKSSLCLSSRKECQTHFQWEKIHRALIDTDRWSALQLLEEIRDRQLALRAAAAGRNSVLSLLMHDVIETKTETDS